MLEMSDAAKKELDAYFEGKERGVIRIYQAPGGCSGPVLLLALDDAGKDDSVEEVGGYKFCINKELLELIGGAKIDVSPLGFMITPDNPLPQTSGGCGGCCGSCGGH